MGDREVEFDEDAKCDQCGAAGAWDFMGDFICQECYKKAVLVEEASHIAPCYS